MEGIQHRNVSVNGISMHVAEMGQGPLVLLLHGFPELWYSWRHQIVHLAANGYRAVAPDLRGYGDTTGAPTDDHTKFTMLHIAADLIGLIDHAIYKDQSDDDHEEKVFVVGHDWGAIIAWHLCLYRPDKVKALVNLSVPFLRRDPKVTTVEIFQKLYGDDHYVARFQAPGEIEAELATIGAKTCMRNFIAYRNPGPLYFPKGKGFGHIDTPVVMPPWLSEEDVDYYASKFEQTGFTGGVNYYRAWDLSWELNAPWSGAKVKVPSKFIIGDLDLVYHIPGMKEYIGSGEFCKDVPMLEEVVVMEGVAHFINQEKPEEINNHILDFFNKF